MEVFLKPYELKLRHTFTISRRSYSGQQTLIAVLKDGEFTGLGEATSNSYYGITVQKMIDDIRHVQSVIESLNNR